MRISIQHDDFDVSQLYNELKATNTKIGAVATFCGIVRDFGTGQDIDAIYLEHYPGMTEQSLNSLAIKTLQQFHLEDIVVVHRVGYLRCADNIVFVGCASSHRQSAFDACQYTMDQLKTKAPFWKKEIKRDGSSHWVDARPSDQKAADRWL